MRGCFRLSRRYSYMRAGLPRDHDRGKEFDRAPGNSLRRPRKPSLRASSSTDRVADFESEGCRFESYLRIFFSWSLAQLIS